MRAAPLLLLLLALPACGGTEPAAAPRTSASASPSPTVTFPAAAAQALLGAADVPKGFLVPERPDDPVSRVLSLCDSGAPPPQVPEPAPLRRVQLVGERLVSIDQQVAVLPDDAAGDALLQAVTEHAATCPLSFEDDLPVEQGGGSYGETRTPPVDVVVGEWSGLRQSSRIALSTPQRASTSSVQVAVVRRGNAVVRLRLVLEGRQPDLAAVLRPLLAKIDATATPRQ